MRIYNVETTNYCNAECDYCPYPKMTREKGFMSVETFKKVLEKQELDFMELHNFGEPLVDPQIFKFIRMAKEAGFKTRLSTNGLLLNRDVLSKLADAGLDLMWVSIRHYFDQVKKTLDELYLEYSKKIEIIIYYVELPKRMRNLPKQWKVTRLIPHTWSKQIEGVPFTMRNDSCFNLREKAVTVLWDGRVSNCCHDFDGKYIIGTIDDEGLEPKAVELCGSCEFYHG